MNREPSPTQENERKTRPLFIHLDDLVVHHKKETAVVQEKAAAIRKERPGIASRVVNPQQRAVAVGDLFENYVALQRIHIKAHNAELGERAAVIPNPINVLLGARSKVVNARASHIDMRTKS